MKHLVLIYALLLLLPPGVVQAQPVQGKGSVEVEITPGVVGVISFDYLIGKNGDTVEGDDSKTLRVDKGTPVPVTINNYNFKGFRDAALVETVFLFPPKWPLKNRMPQTLREKGAYINYVAVPNESIELDSPIRVKVSFGDQRREATYRIPLKLEIRGEEQTLPAVPSPAPAAPPQRRAGAERPKQEQSEPAEAASPVTGNEAGGGDEPDGFIVSNASELSKIRDRIKDVVIEYEDEVNGNLTTYRLKYLTELEVVSISDTAQVDVVSTRQVGETTFEMVVDVKSAGAFNVVIRDPNKTTKAQRLKLNVGELMGGVFSKNDSTIVFSQLVGGVPPHSLIFTSKGREIKRYDNLGFAGLTISRDTLTASLPEGGFVKVKLVDSRNTGDFTFENAVFDVAEEVRPGINWGVVFGVGGALVVIGIFQYFRLTRKRKKLQEIRKQVAENSAAIIGPERAPGVAAFSGKPDQSEEIVRELVDEEEEEATSTTIAEEITGEVDAGPQKEEKPTLDDIVLDTSVSTSGTASGKKKSRMKITRRREPEDGKEIPFLPFTYPNNYLELPMVTHWDTSMIDAVLIGKNAIRKLDQFLRQENTDLIAANDSDREVTGWERNEVVPEIGGMIMGQFHRNPATNTYRVSLEEFVPLEAKYQSIVKVEIDPLSLARDLGEAQDKYPDYTVVAWFHTHPGHGLFLSRPDLKIHHSHFRKPYHLAMEIDSLSENLDTAFFTYMPSGQMNNRHSLRPDTPWFSWSEIEKFTRHKPTM